MHFYSPNTDQHGVEDFILYIVHFPGIGGCHNPADFLVVHIGEGPYVPHDGMQLYQKESEPSFTPDIPFVEIQVSGNVGIRYLSTKCTIIVTVM